MTQADADSKRDRWSSIVLSVVLHGGVAGAIFFGWWRMQHRPPPPQPTLAIEATIVDSKSLQPPTPVAHEPVKPAPVEQPPPQPEPTPEPAPAQPPQPTPEELEQKQQQEDQQREDAERAAAEAKQRELQSQREAEHRQEEDAKQADQARKELEAKRQAEAKRASEAKRLADEKHEADEQRIAEEQRVADEKRKTEEARERAQSEAELKRSLQAEEHANQLRSSGALASWVNAIAARIQRAWIRPPSARVGLDCTIEVTQVPGGQVTNVQLGACNGDAAVRESIEAAVYRASPLPPPPDPSLFERDLSIRFVPTE